MSKLPAKFSDVLRRRAEGETLEDIARSYGLTRERIRQIESMAKERARRLLGKAGALRLA